jgi:predicted XRE-type DNA-binding protein
MKQKNIENTTIAALRKKSGQVKQAVVALEMNVQEPAVSKLERKRIVDTSIDKLQRYVRAVGGELSLAITLPDGTVMKLT